MAIAGAATVHTTIDLLDAAKARQGVSSDYKLALLLHVKPSAVGNYRHGRSHPDDEICGRLADLAGLDRGYVVACVHATRALGCSPRTYEVWFNVAGRLRASGSALLVTVSLGAFSGTSDGGALASTTDAQPGSVRASPDCFIN